MAAAVHDFTIEQGTTVDEFVIPPILCQYSNGALYDLTGWQGKAEIRSKAISDIVITEFELAFDIPNSKVQLILSADKSNLLPGGKKVVYDCKIWKDGIERRIVKGIITVDAAVTKNA